jgi:hypothetical protein
MARLLVLKTRSGPVRDDTEIGSWWFLCPLNVALHLCRVLSSYPPATDGTDKARE